METIMNQCLEAARHIVGAYNRRYWAATDALNGSSSPPPAPTITYEAPVQPSMAEVTTEAIRLLPTQKKIELAARMGTAVDYDDPGTGAPTTADFRGFGDVDLARQRQEFELESAREMAPELLDFYQEYGPQYAQSAREQLEVSDPYGFAAREQLGGDVMAAGENIPELPDAPTLQQAGAGPSLERLAQADIPVLPLDPDSLGSRQFAEQKLIERVYPGETSRLLGEKARRAARGRQTATGNIFGGGAAISEARSVQEAEEAATRQGLSDYLAFLSSGQSAQDYQSRIAQQNLQNRMLGIGQRTGATQAERADEMNTLAQRNQAAQQAYANAVGQIQGQEGLRQQRLANLQAFAFGQPLVSQLGALGGMQQQAAPYMPAQMQAGMGMQGQLGAGAQFAQQGFGTAGNIYGSQLQAATDIYNTQAKIASQPGAFGQILGTLGGAFAGTAGAGLAGSMFSGSTGGLAAISGKK